MRVLHLVKSSVGAVWAWRQIRELRALGVDAQVVLPGSGPMVERYEAEGIPIHRLDLDLARMRAPGTFLARRRALDALLASLRPDLLHSHFVSTTLFARLALGRRGPRRVFQVPGPLHLEHALPRKADVWSANRRDWWIATCEMTRRVYLAEGIEASRIGFSFYGTDLGLHTGGRPGRLRPELQVGPQTRLIGMVAYAYPPKAWLGYRRGIKGHEDLIDAVRLLLDAGRDVRLVFAGGAWIGGDAYLASIKRYAAERLGGNVVFLGSRSDVPDIYADLDVAVHPSHSENTGAAVESLLAGAPTIASNVGGLPDVVIDGETGWLCPPKDPPSLARVIGTVLDNPDEGRRRAAAGRAHVTRELDVRRTARQVLEFYRGLGPWKRS